MAGDRPEPEIARALGYVVTPGYADALRLRVREGRFLDVSDATAAVQPMVVNEEFVRQYLRDGKPVLGRRYENVLKRDAATEIVGVVGSVLRTGFGGAPQAEFYVPLGNEGLVTAGREIYLVMRSNAGAATIASALRPIVREIDSTAPLHTVRALDDELAATAGEPRFAVVTLAAFAMLALGLAAIGLHGGLTYALSQRTHELGIRSALGASRRGLVALVVRDTVVVTASGLVLGLIGAAAGTRAIRGLLVGLDSLDGVSFLAAPALLVCAALVPCAIAAWRITRLAPSAVLRQE